MSGGEKLKPSIVKAKYRSKSVDKGIRLTVRQTERDLNMSDSEKEIFESSKDEEIDNVLTTPELEDVKIKLEQQRKSLKTVQHEKTVPHETNMIMEMLEKINQNNQDLKQELQQSHQNLEKKIDQNEKKMTQNSQNLEQYLNAKLDQNSQNLELKITQELQQTKREIRSDCNKNLQIVSNKIDALQKDYAELKPKIQEIEQKLDQNKQEMEQTLIKQDKRMDDIEYKMTINISEREIELQNLLETELAKEKMNLSLYVEQNIEQKADELEKQTKINGKIIEDRLTRKIKETIEKSNITPISKEEIQILQQNTRNLHEKVFHMSENLKENTEKLRKDTVSKKEIEHKIKESIKCMGEQIKKEIVNERQEEMSQHNTTNDNIRELYNAAQPNVNHDRVTQFNNLMLNKIENIPAFYNNFKLHPMKYLYNIKTFIQTNFNNDYILYHHQIINIVKQTLKGEVELWYNIVEQNCTSFQIFEYVFKKQYWNSHIQNKVRNKLVLGRYNRFGNETRELYAMKLYNEAMYLEPQMMEYELVERIANHYGDDIALQVTIKDINSFDVFLDYIRRIDDIETRRNNRENDRRNRNYEENRYRRDDRQRNYDNRNHNGNNFRRNDYNNQRPEYRNSNVVRNNNGNNRNVVRNSEPRTQNNIQRNLNNTNRQTRTNPSTNVTDSTNQNF